MSTFLLVAAAMVAVAVASVLWPLLRPGRGPGVQRKSANASIYRDQFADLDADLARGTISAEKHAEARSELERRVLEDVTEQRAPQSIRPQKWTAIAIAVAVPVAATLLYLRLGASTDVSQQVATDSNAPMSEQQIIEMVAQLAERLKKEPDNVEGWFILARSYYAMGRYAESAGAFERLDTLRPNDPNILADLADALAMSRNRDISGPPLALVERALKLDPKQGKALAIAGTAAFERKDYAAAVSYWERLVATQAPDSDIAKTVQASIEEARLRGKLPAPASRVAQLPSTEGTAAKGKSAAVSGTVTLSPALASRAAATDTVFVYARAAEGGRMPLAILRAQVKDLPLAFKLDDTLSMSPAAKISGVKEVIVTARVSRSGSATPQSGDLEGASGAVSVGTEALTIAIDRALP